MDFSRRAMSADGLGFLLKKLFCILGLLIIYRIPVAVLPVLSVCLLGSGVGWAFPLYAYYYKSNHDSYYNNI